jgi:hypothetical protein
VVDEPDAVERVRIDEEDDSGGVGIEDSLPEGWERCCEKRCVSVVRKKRTGKRKRKDVPRATGR